MKTMRVKRLLMCSAAVMLLAMGTLRIAAQDQGKDSPPAAKQKRSDAVNRLTIEVSGGDDNKAVENASVYVKYVESRLLKDKKTELNVKTNREGMAHVADAPLGRALIQVVAEGWKTYGRWYEVTEPQQIIKVHLERPPKWY